MGKVIGQMVAVLDAVSDGIIRVLFQEKIRHPFEGRIILLGNRKRKLLFFPYGLFIATKRKDKKDEG